MKNERAADESSADGLQPQAGISSDVRTTAIKGPGERTKYDFKRVWECPACHARERTGGEVVSRICACQAEQPVHTQLWMKLIQDGPRRVVKASSRQP